MTSIGRIILSTYSIVAVLLLLLWNTYKYIVKVDKKSGVELVVLILVFIYLVNL